MAANIMDSGESCFIHFLNGKGELKRVTETNFCQIIEQRNGWLSLRNDELSTSEAVKVAEKIEHIEEDYDIVIESDALSFHKSCYTKFTN